MTAMPIAVKSHCHWSIKSRSSPNVTAGRKGATQHNSSCVIAGAHTRDDGPNQLALTIGPSPRKPESSEVMYDYELTQTLTQVIKSRIPKTRIESLTDLIFGLALSIGSFSLLSKPPLSPADVIMDLVGFAFSFLILISIWFRYTDIMSVLRVETGGTMFLNAVMLFLVTVEPYLLSLLTFGSFQTPGVAVLIFASEAYALDLAGLTFIMGLFTHQLTIEERRLVKPDLVGKYRRIRNVQYSAATLFAVSALPAFWSWEIIGTPVRFYLWYAVLVFIWISRLSGRSQKVGSWRLKFN
jgi:uncharacterized membrane protein